MLIFFLRNRCYSKNYTLKINFNKYYYLELWFFTIQLHVKIELDGFWEAALYHNSLVRVNVLIIINPQCTSSLNKSVMKWICVVWSMRNIWVFGMMRMNTIFCRSKLPLSHWQISLYPFCFLVFFSSESIFLFFTCTCVKKAIVSFTMVQPPPFGKFNGGK